MSQVHRKPGGELCTAFVKISLYSWYQILGFFFVFRRSNCWVLRENVCTALTKELDAIESNARWCLQESYIENKSFRNLWNAHIYFSAVQILIDSQLDIEIQQTNADTQQISNYQVLVMDLHEYLVCWYCSLNSRQYSKHTSDPSVPWRCLYFLKRAEINVENTRFVQLNHALKCFLLTWRWNKKNVRFVYLI